MILRRSFLKLLALPVVAPVLKFLPKPRPFAPLLEPPWGVVSGTAGHGLRQGDLLRVDATGVIYRMEDAGQYLIGVALEDAPAGGSVLVNLMSP